MKIIANFTAVLSLIAAAGSVWTGLFVHQRLPQLTQQITEQQSEIVQLRTQVTAVTMMTAAEFGGHAKFGGRGGGGGTNGGAGGGGGGGAFGGNGGNGGSINYGKRGTTPPRPIKR